MELPPPHFHCYSLGFHAEELSHEGISLPGSSELSVQVFGDVLILKVIILCPVDSKLPVLGDQFQDCPEALGCVELSVSTLLFPGIDCEQLQGILWGQRLPQLLFTLRRERNKNKLCSAVV